METIQTIDTISPYIHLDTLLQTKIKQESKENDSVNKIMQLFKFHMLPDVSDEKYMIMRQFLQAKDQHKHFF